MYSQKALIFLISIVALADIAAFFIGKRFGKKVFLVLYSPNKTTEGFIGSISSLLASLFFCFMRIIISYLQ